MSITTASPPPSMQETHAEIQALLPWYASETLNVDETHKVEQHLRQCADCQAELAQCRALAKAVQAEPGHWQPAPDAFDRLMADIEQLETKPAAKTAPISSLFQRIQAWFEITPGPIRWTLALETMAVAALVLVMATPGLRTAADYETLSSNITQGTAPGPRLHIIFTDSATISDMQRLLLDIEGNIIAGPTALGVYTVALPSDSGMEPTLSNTLARLRAHSQIRLVEPVARGDNS